MFSIYFKELNVFFSSLTAYLSVGVFLLVSGLFLWVFPETSILEYGYASLESFFTLAPWILMFLVPAITMRSFAEEISTGTIELLATRPISDWQIILGKFFACLSLIVVAILPTFIYYFSVYQLGVEVGNVDSGATYGSYLGLIFLSAIFTSIGIFTSSLTSNQIVAFLGAVFLCFFFYSAFDSFSQLSVFYAKWDMVLQNMGIAQHYNAISKGVVDSRDVVYFVSVSAWFLTLCWGVFQFKK